MMNTLFPLIRSTILAIALVATSGCLKGETPTNNEIAKLCIERMKGIWHQRGLNHTGNPIMPGAGVIIGDAPEITGIDKVSESEIVAKVLITMTWTKTLLVFSYGPTLVGEKGKVQQSEERCRLRRYDTGWSAEEWVGAEQ